MLSACKNPRPTHRCGQCEYCRVLEQLDKINRLKLEFARRPYALFVTITYDDLHLPVFSGLAELWPLDLESYINRIRNSLPKITIFAVGEYGGKLFGSPKAERDIHPHYHLAIFSDDPNFYALAQNVLTKKWKFGHTHILRLSAGLINYIVGYVSKKITNEHSMKKIMGLDIQPEFTYSSRRPAIGDVTDELIPIQEEHGEITHLSVFGKQVVIPKYLKFKLKDHFLKWDLDLKDPKQLTEYKRRKYEKKIETLQKLFEKNQEQMAEIDARNINGDVYKKRSTIRKQIIANFNAKLALKQKGSKLL